MMKKSKSMHDGHRDRLREKFIRYGLSNLAPHEVVELMLYSVVPRKDVNPLAHELLEGFGSFSAFLDAPVEELVKYSGIGRSGAITIKLFSAVGRYYIESKVDKGPTSMEEVIEIIMSKFAGRTNEAVVLTLLDGKGKVLYCGVVTEGTANSCDVYLRRIVGLAASYDATQAILAHNHPSGFALPSRADLQTTIRVKEALALVNVTLIDHMIVADGDYVSMAQDEGKLHTGIFEIGDEYDMPSERKAVADWDDRK